jgi:nitroreductase
VDVLEAIRKRKSIRGFKPDPVSREVLTEILETACRTPSPMNTQPWEFFILTGPVLDAIKNKHRENFRTGVPAGPEHLVVGWPKDSVYRERQVELAKQLFQLMDIQREDMEKRLDWMERGFRFFEAPAAVIVVVDRSLSEGGPLMDIGAVMQTLCLAALPYGLGTCIEDQGVMYPKDLRKLAGIPDSKRIIMAVAIGYPDPDFPANRVETEREHVEKISTWIGFD